MKRVALLVFAALMVAVLGVLAADVSCEKRFLFSIEEKTIMLGTGTLDFPSNSDVTKPDATGWFESNPWQIRLDTNTKVQVTLFASCFTREGTHKTLPTAIRGTGNFYFTSKNIPGSVYVGGNLWQVKSWTFASGAHAGYIYLRVYRNSINDPAAKYVALVRVTATAIP